MNRGHARNADRNPTGFYSVRCTALHRPDSESTHAARFPIPGFTLIEIVITVAIVGLLASAVLPLAQLGAKRVKEQELRTALRQIRQGIDAYKIAAEQGHVVLDIGQSGYPPMLDGSSTA